MKIVTLTLAILLVSAHSVSAQSRDQQIQLLFDGSEKAAEDTAKDIMGFVADVWSNNSDESSRREACRLLYDYAGYPRGTFWSLVKSMAERCVNGQLRRNLDVRELKRNRPANYTPGSAKLFEYCMGELLARNRGSEYDRWCESYLNDRTWAFIPE